MALNERKIKILDGIIRDYISTAEPIGSRTIAKKFDLGVSSATIRNEMSDLEEMGFIVQPHSSSGRVPSDKGYRYYVDTLMQRRRLSEEQELFLKNIIAKNINRIDYLMKETAKAIAVLTNYTTIISEPRITGTRIKHLQLVPIDDYSVLMVLVTESKVIKQSVLRLGKRLSYEDLAWVSAVLSGELAGKGHADLTESYCLKLKKKLGPYAYILDPIMDAALNTIITEENVEIYTSGFKNLLSFPEFSDLDKARELFNTLEERQTLISLIGGPPGGAVQIVIGEENGLRNLRDCSVIKANYSLGGQTYGNIGIIGPTRMEYAQVVSVLTSIVDSINNILEINGGEESP